VLRVVGDNVEVDLPVAPWELALGATVDVPTLEGAATVRIPPGTPNGRVIRLRGLGWPKKVGSKGNMLVRLVAAVPAAENDRQRQAYEELSRAFAKPVRSEWEKRARV
jgi:curved DNA-binding protein